MLTPKKYKRIAVHDAVQWDGSTDHATEIIEWVDDEGGFAVYKPPAGQRTAPYIKIYNDDNPDAVLYEGEWAVKVPDGDFDVHSAAYFGSEYTELDEQWVDENLIAKFVVLFEVSPDEARDTLVDLGLISRDV